MIAVGVDPGVSGGLSFLYPDGKIQAYKMPETERDLYDLLDRFRDMPRRDLFALIEKVHSSPQMGVKSAFTFGQNYGTLRGMLIACRIPFEEVRPIQWQRIFSLVFRGRKMGDREKKLANRAKAQQLFPEIRVTHAIADSLLIAEYCRRVHSDFATLRMEGGS